MARTGLCFWKISLAGRGENGNGLRSWRSEGWLRVLPLPGPEGGGLAQAGEGEQWAALRGIRKENELDLGPHGRWRARGCLLALSPAPWSTGAGGGARGEGGLQGQHLGQEGLDVCSPMGVTSLPASRHVPIFISCARNFPAASRVTWKEEGREEVPPPQQLAHKAAPG